MLYECAGDIPMNDQIKLLIESGIPEDIVQCIDEDISNERCIDVYTRSRNGYHTKLLPPAVVLKNTDSFNNIITKISSKSKGIRLVDLVVLRYGVYSFNDQQKHLISYFRHRSDYMTTDSNTFCAIIEIELNNNSKLKLALIWSAFHSKLKDDKYSTITERREYGICKFPRVVNSIFTEERIIGQDLIISEFVKFCRKRVRK